jgi:hypothetical protein
MAAEMLQSGVMNITVETKVRYNGKEYDSPDGLPPEVRAIYDRALTGAAPGLTVNENVKTVVTINGERFSSADQLPAGQKKLYDDAMQLIRDTQAGATTLSSGEQRSDVTAERSQLTNERLTKAVDTGWLTKRQIQLIIVVAGLLLALAVILRS